MVLRQEVDDLRRELSDHRRVLDVERREKEKVRIHNYCIDESLSCIAWSGSQCRETQCLRSSNDHRSTY